MDNSGNSAARLRVRGKVLADGTGPVWLRGVTYGPFRPTACGSEYHTPERVDADFAAMAAAQINTVRTYTVPPR